MKERDEAWMAYIDTEVRSACRYKEWSHQVRRSWASRTEEVASSTLEDFEWKLIPSGSLALSEETNDWEGVYYLLWFSRSRGKIVVQHDTHHVSCLGPNWERTTFTELDVRPETLACLGSRAAPGVPSELPPAGWLRDHLLHIVGCFAPNSFSIT